MTVPAITKADVRAVLQIMLVRIRSEQRFADRVEDHRRRYLEGDLAVYEREPLPRPSSP